MRAGLLLYAGCLLLAAAPVFAQAPNGNSVEHGVRVERGAQGVAQTHAAPPANRRSGHIWRAQRTHQARSSR